MIAGARRAAPASCDRARAAAIEIGERLLEEIEWAPYEDPNFERYPSRCLNGTVGFALTFLALAVATGDSRFERAMHAQIKLAAHAPQRGTGLFDGVAGLRVMLELACALEPRYRGLVAQCDASIDSAARDAVWPPQWVGDYDLAFGAAGMRLSQQFTQAPSEDLLTERLTWLLAGDERWPALEAPTATGTKKHWLGMAHGIAGVLSSLAQSSHDMSDELGERMTNAAWRLARIARYDEEGYSWPRAREDSPSDDRRAVWCVGAAGIGSALLHVARAVKDRQLERFALDVLRDLATRPLASMRLGGLGLCHGTMGNALVMFCAAQRTGDDSLARGCERFVDAALDDLDRGDGRFTTAGFDGVPYDAIGVSNGVAGVALALLTIAQDFDDRWLLCFGLPPSDWR